ncbi:glycosyltransferase [Salimicrobium halophilum]|uniref:Glycosyltransferase, catalytic subunit of cellulose synthase and poly-beta-1,6-N-acetylglucosamine synthase n=1 Tax=Salimicrobium halophilum TaxID=86666 RepID=A0A1G8RNP3_9BACI|nr:glycosyltransferase family 2 protein [Salimicrobium halophilum]SDJ18513.1 Glycosyltransferase, catalytic subunit of cellulose synthase and poly-beta-1,6-N-acetylglucosamine synthase [Salimicrobium halophilum]
MDLLFLIGVAGLFLWTLLNHFFLPSLSPRPLDKHPFVSVLIPLRNEEGNVEALVDSLKRITYTNIEFVLLDDQSEDDTHTLLQTLTKQDDRFRIVRGKGLKEGWNGKVYACHQLSGYASGDSLLFLDADVRISPGAVEKFLALQRQKNAAFISGFPAFLNSCLLGHLLVPMQHFVISLHLPLFLANKTNIPMFTAAFGGCLFIDREAYDDIGGHTKVYNSLVEDVHLAKEMKKNGKRTILANVTSDISCRMYTTNRDVWSGFKKNIFPGLGRSLFLAAGVMLFYVTVFLFPFIAAVVAGGYWWYVCLLLILLKMFVDIRTSHPWWVSFFIPFSIISMVAVLLASISVDRRKKQYEWKGRTYS